MWIVMAEEDGPGPESSPDLEVLDRALADWQAEQRRKE
jgi:hypothetical protein